MGQKAQVWWDLPALDSFLLLKEIYQIPQKQFSESVEFLSDSLMIHEQLKVPVRKLSLGERMKVELMAALLHRPKIVFLDEPTIGLDLMAQKAVRNFIRQYRKEFKTIMLLTSHYMEDIENLCKRVVIMQEGQFIFDGDLSTIKSRYALAKKITATTSEGDKVAHFIANFPNELGQIALKKDQIHVLAPRENAMETASYLLNNIKVTDLNIHEEDIGDIITQIMQEGSVHA